MEIYVTMDMKVFFQIVKLHEKSYTLCLVAEGFEPPTNR
jgi:hypothetical protein